MSNIIDKIQLSGTVYTIGNETTTAVTSASTDNEIPTAKAVYDAIPTGGTSGGKAVSAGTNISITTGETADTINCTLNLENGTNSMSGGLKMKSFVAGNVSTGRDSCAFGGANRSTGINSFVCGYYNTGSTFNSFISGLYNEATNDFQTVFGVFASSNGNDTSGWMKGGSGSTLFAIGNGESQRQLRHNAFEIRQNGDIYIADTNDTSTSNYYEKPMIKLQDALGGGGSYSAGTNISITNNTINCTLPISSGSSGYNSLILGGMSDATAEGSVSWGYHTVAFGNESFAGGQESQAYGFVSHAEGYGVAANNDYEFSVGYNNLSSSASTDFGDSGNTLFSVGNGYESRHNAFEIRQNGDIYCSDGTNDVKLQDTITATAANTTALGGLSLVKITQAQYDALTTKDSNTLYIING